MELAADGVIRISGSRVTLDSVMGVFAEGASAEVHQTTPSPASILRCRWATSMR